MIVFASKALLDGDKIDANAQLPLINDAIRDIGKKTPYTAITILNFTTNISYVDLPERFKGVSSLTYNGTPLEYKHPSKIKDLTETSDIPKYYYMANQKLYIHPIPTKNMTLNLVYRKAYATLSSLAEEPIDLPEDYHESICYFIAWKIVDTDDEGIFRFNSFEAEYNKRIALLAIENETDMGEYEQTVDVLPARAPR
jgi:hypothetical protein